MSPSLAGALSPQSPRPIGVGQFSSEMTLTLLESRLPVAISLPLLAFVVGNEREEWRAPVVALPLAFGAAKQPDQVVMHRAVIRAEPVDQRLDIELRRLAAHRMPAMTYMVSRATKVSARVLLGHGALPLKGFAELRILFLISYALATGFGYGALRISE